MSVILRTVGELTNSCCHWCKNLELLLGIFYRIDPAGDRFATVGDTIDKCRANPYMDCYTYLFDQSMIAFVNGQLDLAVIGFTSIIDGLLTDVSGDYTTKIATRASTIIEKLEENETVDSDEYALVILLLTFEKTMELFSASSDFKGEEPEELNRHWSMHANVQGAERQNLTVKINSLYLWYSVA